MENECRISLAVAARLPELKVDGQGPHTSTVLRWCRQGQGGVCLECEVVGGRRVTSREAVLRFIARRTRLAQLQTRDSVHLSPVCAPPEVVSTSPGSAAEGGVP